jgi:hypothetical protein
MSSATQDRLHRGLRALQNGDIDTAENILREVAADPFLLSTPAGLPPQVEASFLTLKRDLALSSNDLTAASSAESSLQSVAAPTPSESLALARGLDLLPVYEPSRDLALLSADNGDNQNWSVSSERTWDGETLRETDHLVAFHEAHATAVAVDRDDPQTVVSEHVHALRTNELFHYTEATPDGLIREVHCEREVETIERIRHTVTLHGAPPIAIPAPTDYTSESHAHEWSERTREHNGDVPTLSQVLSDELHYMPA